MQEVSLILSLFEIQSSTGRDSINFKTVSASQIKEYLGRGVLWLNIPDMSAQNGGEPEPESNSEARKSNIKVISHRMGSTYISRNNYQTFSAPIRNYFFSLCC